MFQKCGTVAEVKNRYRELCFQYHPDVSGGDTTRQMQDINDLYLDTLKSMDGQTRKFEGREFIYYYNRAKESALITVLSNIIRAQLPPLVLVEIVGVYIWISGTEKDDMDTRKVLTDNKFQWHGVRERWFWKPPGQKTRYNRKASFHDLKVMYGSRVVDGENQPALSAG